MCLLALSQLWKTATRYCTGVTTSPSTEATGKSNARCWNHHITQHATRLRKK